MPAFDVNIPRKKPGLLGSASLIAQCSNTSLLLSAELAIEDLSFDRGEAAASLRADMGRLYLAIAAFGFLIVAISAADARRSSAASGAVAQRLAPRPAAYIVVDVDSGMILGQREADKVWYPASVTKL